MPEAQASLRRFLPPDVLFLAIRQNRSAGSVKYGYKCAYPLEPAGLVTLEAAKSPWSWGPFPLSTLQRKLPYLLQL